MKLVQFIWGGFMKHLDGNHQKWADQKFGNSAADMEKIRQQKRKQAKKQKMSTITSPKLRLTTFLLAYFLGILGIHRFYVGKIRTGVLWMFTLGFLGIGSTIDAIYALCGEFKDAEGRSILKWINKENQIAD